MFESVNPPILSLHVSSLTMSNSSPYKQKLKKFQHLPHSHVTYKKGQVHEQAMPPKKLALSSDFTFKNCNFLVFFQIVPDDRHALRYKR